MKNKRYIYPWLILPLIACLLAGMAGCSDDVTDEGGASSPDGSTYLTVTARGITDVPAADGSYDDYVASLRILAFDESGKVLCNELYKKEAGNGVKQWTPVGDDAISIKEKIGNGGGKYSFYFIANEEGYHTMDGNKTLQEKLKAITQKDDLKSIEISFSQDETNGGKALLMTAVEENYPIIAGKENLNMVVYLERALAKARIKVAPKDSQNSPTFSVSNVKLTSGQIPSSYALLKGVERATKHYLDSDIGMAGSMEGTTYTSKTIYMPERIPQDPNNVSQALKVSLDVTVDSQSKSCELPIGDGSKTPVDYTINRNSDYTTTGLITEWGEPIIIHATVAAWITQTENREWLGAAEVEFKANPMNSNKTNSKGELCVVYGEDNPTVVKFSIKVTKPLGNTWTVVCSNPAQFEATIEDGSDGGIIDGTGTEHTITIKAKDAYPVDLGAEQPQTFFYVTFSNGDYSTDMVIRQGSDSFDDGYAGGTQTRFLIVQEQTVTN